ncbi:MAG: EI24 domain-containing protein [Myxococcales bacterium]|nr:EI24 domain-containing protein [Myxococcales bacterium]
MPVSPVGSRFMAGVSAAWSGMRLALRSPEVRRAYVQMVGVLFVVAAALDVAGIWAVLHWTPIDGDTSWWATIGLWVARILGVAVVLLVAPLISLSVVNLVFPFLGERVFLASMRVISPARAEQLAGQPGLPLASGLVITVLRLLLFFGASLLAFVVSLVPVVGQVAGPVLQGYLSARGLAWELLDPYLDALGLGFAEQRAFVAAHRPALVGFGLPLAMLMAVPLVGPLLFGVAQGAVARLVIDVIEAPAAPHPAKVR